MKRSFVIAATVLCASAMRAQDGRLPAPSARSFIEAQGHATVTAQPDQAKIDIGITTQGNAAETVAAENAHKADRVLNQLRSELGPKAQIKTVSYSLTPVYRYPKEGGPPSLTGYTAQNTVRVSTGDISSVGKIIDLATRSGANDIQLLQFTLKNEQPVRAQALREAAAEAKLNAEAIAAGLGLKLTQVISAREAGPSPIQPLRQMALAPRAQAGSMQPPVEPGPIEVQASVTVQIAVQ